MPNPKTQSASQAGEPDKPPVKSQPEKPRPFEILLPGERGTETAFTFRPPRRENLVASANRLLKFEFPPIRERKVYERLLKTNAVSSGLSKKALDALPFPTIESIYQALWRHFLAARPTPEDEYLSLFLLMEAARVFRPEAIMREDIRLLGAQDAGVVHAYYYQETLNREQLVSLLAGHGYRTDFMADNPSEASLPLRYLACRALSRPLPWTALLETLTDSELERFPRLHWLKLAGELLSQQEWMGLSGSGITSDGWEKTVGRMERFLASSPLKDLASKTGLARPVRALAIVEGETERLLLPRFAKRAGLDFNALGIEILPAGGKNHVMTLYKEHAERLRVPICILLDADAGDIAEDLHPSLRSGDYIYSIAEGEFEDLYDLKLILKTVNRTRQPYPELTLKRYRELSRVQKAQGRVQALKVVWQAYGLGSFDKIEFANQYAETFAASGAETPPAIQALLDTLVRIRDGQTVSGNSG